MIHTALISVSDKTGILELATQLTHHNIKLFSTGGSHKALQSAHIPCQSISKLTGYPEILEGRVKTLHPKIYGGILANTDHEGHCKDLESMHIQLIDMVIVNLYPFETKSQAPHTLTQILEYIDIGGVSLLRAAAKNFQRVLVVSDPKDYADIISVFQKGESFSYEQRLYFAQKAFQRTAHYDRTIHHYLTQTIQTEH